MAILETFPQVFCFPKSRINENGGKECLLRNTKECCVVFIITCYCFRLGVSSKLCPELKLTHLFRKYFHNYFIKSVRIHKQSYKVIASLCYV